MELVGIWDHLALGVSIRTFFLSRFGIARFIDGFFVKGSALNFMLILFHFNKCEHLARLFFSVPWLLLKPCLTLADLIPIGLV
jgi:hypothetical protein